MEGNLLLAVLEVGVVASAFCPGGWVTLALYVELLMLVTYISR